MANLLQVSSGYGRAMESVDRTRMSRALYPTIQKLLETGTISKDGGRECDRLDGRRLFLPDQPRL